MTIPKAELKGIEGYKNGVLNVGLDYLIRYEQV
jgi:hypothetical protein